MIRKGKELSTEEEEALHDYRTKKTLRKCLVLFSILWIPTGGMLGWYMKNEHDVKREIIGALGSIGIDIAELKVKVNVGEIERLRLNSKVFKQWTQKN